MHTVIPASELQLTEETEESKRLRLVDSVRELAALREDVSDINKRAEELSKQIHTLAVTDLKIVAAPTAHCYGRFQCDDKVVVLRPYNMVTVTEIEVLPKL